jgi:hypothetical protein
MSRSPVWTVDVAGNGATGVAAIIGAVGAGLPALVAWWRSTRVARVKADESAWGRVNQTIRDQQNDNEALRRRVATVERNLRTCAGRHDRLMGILDSHGIPIPAGYQDRPWENGDPSGQVRRVEPEGPGPAPGGPDRAN